MKQEIAQLKVEKRLSDVQWTGKEQNYKKTVQQLQSKVSPLMKQNVQSNKKSKNRLSVLIFLNGCSLLYLLALTSRLATWRAS